MLEEILDYIHNYFVKEVHEGDFTISNGVLDVDFLLNNQYYKIVGSIFNDGVHKNEPVSVGENGQTTSTLVDEQFVGEIWSMAVPPAVIDLAAEISAWVTKYGDTANSPYASESFGGYSYTKASTVTPNGNTVNGWKSVFGSRLNTWRKIS